MELWESLSAQNHIEKVLLVNAALDLGYMAGKGKTIGSERMDWIWKICGNAGSIPDGF
ncbi:MAG: hypothetical protein WD398_02650 [Cyclobacteriaceae bacterium]